MSLVRLINENGTHIFLNCLNKNVAPGGSITVSEHEVNSNTEILSAIAAGAFRKDELTQPTSTEDAETTTEIDPSEEETVEVKVPPPVIEEPKVEPETQVEDGPEAESPNEKGYFVHDIDREPSVEGKSFVKTRQGVREGKSLDMSMPPHMIDRFGDHIKDKPEEAEKKEMVGGIEIINPAPEKPSSEMIDGIEIIDTSNSDTD